LSSGGGAQGGGQNGDGSGGGIAYGSSDDPFANLKAGNNGLSAAERRAALDARLQQSYGNFDGVIVAEREKAQNGANGAAAASGEGGNGDKNGAGGRGAGENGAGDGRDAGSGANGGNAGGGSLILPSASSVIAATGANGNGGGSNSGGGYMPGPATRQGEFDNVGGGATYTPPPDIPTATNDDVVARQLREAAMREPDIQLREKLWNEYRKYTGLPIPDSK
jgi:hypothetical protein